MGVQIDVNAMNLTRVNQSDVKMIETYETDVVTMR